MSTRPPLIGFETRLLAELRQVVTERAAPGALPAAAPHLAAPHPAAPGRPAASPAAPSPAARRQAGRGWPHRRLAMAGGLSAAVAAGLAVTLTVTLSGNGGPLASPPAGPPHFAAATTVAAVLDNAALAAQSEPAVTPGPDQFVYSRIVAGGPRSRESTEYWISVSGARKGRSLDVVPNGSQPKTWGSEPWCQDGFVDGEKQLGGKPGLHCTPREFAAYKPWLPSTTAGMVAFLAHEAFNGDPRHDGGTMVDIAFWLLSRTLLTPGQQAATFRALAGLPHLHVVKRVTDALGRTGIGIGYSAHGESWTTIFDPRTFRTMGAVYANRGGAQRWAVAVPATVVDRVGQRP